MRTYTAYNSAVEMRDVRRECKEIGKGWIKLNEDLHLLERHKVRSNPNASIHPLPTVILPARLQSSLKEEWNQIESQRERLVRARRKFEKSVQQEWFFAGDPTDDEAARQRTVRLNIGGECFNVQARLLLKDRFSLLAATALPAQDSVIKPGVDGCFYFDRDWWLFRHILAYLRDAILPMKEPLLRDLYHEAAFYCLTSLQVNSTPVAG